LAPNKLKNAQGSPFKLSAAYQLVKKCRELMVVLSPAEISSRVRVLTFMLRTYEVFFRCKGRN